MGAPAEVLEEIFTVIEGGKSIGQSAEVIQFPSDNGARTFTAVSKTFQGTNGTGLNYWVAAIAEGARAVSAGALMITVSIPEFFAFAVPCLGLAVGTAWYNIAPDIWDKVGEAIVNAGWTVKGKVVAFMTDNGIIAFPPEAIELLKDELIAAGIFEHGAQLPEYEPAPTEGIKVESNVSVRDMFYYLIGKIPNMVTFTSEVSAQLASIFLAYNDYTSLGSINPFPGYVQPSYGSLMQLNPPQEYVSTSRPETSYVISIGRRFVNGITEIMSVSIDGPLSYMSQFEIYFQGEYTRDGIINVSSVNGTAIDNENLQEGAVYPKEGVPFRTTYPDWLPWEFPDLTGWQIPEVMPIQYPELLPLTEPYQTPAQVPQADPAKQADKGLDKLTDPELDPANNSLPESAIDPDPDPAVSEPEQLPDIDRGQNPDPIEPDPPAPPSSIVPTVPLPNTVGSSRLFTVYNPSQLELGELGAYLWDLDLIDMLRRIWQNPLDGIISLSQVFCTPVTGSAHNIILGFLDSGVSANIVASQFATIDCGTVDIPEQKQNSTDYNPYTSMELYLPFIGITEIDTNEFMGGSIGIKYKIDVYTGTCLAEVRMIRAKDVPNGGIVYTFSGNCSQQLPLTSVDSRELIATLLSAAGAGIGIATGGALGIVGVSAGMAGAVRREMLHVSHSGNLSANAGILGQKKPYVIISRQNPYNANSYNRLYGYPANKTVYLGNCNGYTRVKAGRYRGFATQAEKDEIMEFLTEGVIM